MGSTTHFIDLFSDSGRPQRTTLDISVSTPASCALPSTERIRSVIASVLSGESVRFNSIGIVLTDHETVLELNKTWLEHDYHTDVLSFLIEDDPDGMEGEVYVDVETAHERHAEFGSSPETEIERYIVHGVLHLIGYDDASDDERRAMQQLEDTYLAV